MNHYKDESGQVWGIEAGDPVAPGLVLMSAEEFAMWRDSGRTVAVIAADLQVQVDAVYKRHMGLITAKYPEEERSSWYIQTAQAKAVIAGAADTPTPWLDACAQSRAMGREELAERIIALDAEFQAVHGHLTGVRQWHEEAIAQIVAAAAEDETQAREDLASYDVLQGWPPAA